MNGPALRDIHLPEVSLWWPPAPGWWIVGLSIPLLIFALLWLRRWIRHKPLRKVSLQELEYIRQRHIGGQNEKDVLNEIAQLLRRTMISYRGRAGFAASAGEDWIEQLRQVSPGSAFTRDQLALLSHDRYKPDYSCDIEGLLQACERWLRALPRSESRVSG